MKSILIQQVYPGRGYLPMLQEQFERNTNYCEKFNIDYVFISSEIYDANVGSGGWDKVEHIRRHLDYDLVIWLDADAMIFDTHRDLREVPLPEDSVGAVKFMIPVPHFNVGVTYFRTGPRVRKFVKDWLAMYPGEGLWRDQAAFNKLKDRITELPKEWNRNFDNNPAANPVIMGFHGFGSPANRLKLMCEHGNP